MPVMLVMLPHAAIAVALTIWLARQLSHHGLVFLGTVFPDRDELATAIDQLLVIGFSLGTPRNPACSTGSGAARVRYDAHGVRSPAGPARVRLGPAPRRADAQLGLAVPLTGIALIGPITLDLLLGLALGGTPPLEIVLGFGLAYACFAICCAIHGCQLARRTEPLSLRWMYLFTLVASCVPMGIWVITIPFLAIYVSLTRTPFLLALRAAARIASREHDELAGVAPLPRAIARSA